MKWLTESKAVVYVQQDIIHKEDMFVHVDCEINGIPHSWAKYVFDYICKGCQRMRKIPLQDFLIEAGRAYEKTKNGQ